MKNGYDDEYTSEIITRDCRLLVIKLRQKIKDRYVECALKSRDMGFSKYHK